MVQPGAFRHSVRKDVLLPVAQVRESVYQSVAILNSSPGLQASLRLQTPRLFNLQTACVYQRSGQRSRHWRTLSIPPDWAAGIVAAIAGKPAGRSSVKYSRRCKPGVRIENQGGIGHGWRGFFSGNVVGSRFLHTAVQRARPRHLASRMLFVSPGKFTDSSEM